MNKKIFFLTLLFLVFFLSSCDNNALNNSAKSFLDSLFIKSNVSGKDNINITVSIEKNSTNNNINNNRNNTVDNNTCILKTTTINYNCCLSDDNTQQIYCGTCNKEVEYCEGSEIPTVNDECMSKNDCI